MKKLLFILILPIGFMGCTQSQFASLPCDQLINTGEQIACHYKKMKPKNTHRGERVALWKIAENIVLGDSVCDTPEPLVVLTEQ